MLPIKVTLHGLKPLVQSYDDVTHHSHLEAAARWHLDAEHGHCLVLQLALAVGLGSWPWQSA